MQQFARRPEPGQPDDSPTGLTVSDSLMSQWLEQISDLGKQVAAVRQELEAVKAENQRLRLQVSGMAASQAMVVAPAEPEPVLHAPVEPVQEPLKAEREKTMQEKIDEELLVDLVRAQGVKETTTARVKAEVVETVLAIEETQQANRDAKPQLTDDEIQRMLSEAALGAFDAASEQAPQVEVAEASHEPVHEAPVLRLAEDVPEEESDGIVVLSFEIDRSIAAKVPGHLAIAALAVPYRAEGNKIVCKTVAPFDQPSLDMIADVTASEIVTEPAPIAEVVLALRTVYGDESRETEREAVWNVSVEQPAKKRGLFRRSAKK